MTAAVQADDCLIVLGNRTDERQCGVSYKTNGYSPFGMAVSFPEEMEVNEKDMCLWIPIADGGRKDDVGDRIDVAGIRTERHVKNPIMLFDHGKNVQLPIGMAAVWDPSVCKYDLNKYTYKCDPATQKAGALTYFWQGKGSMSGPDRDRQKDHAIFCEQLFHMAATRLLNSGSIGYKVIHAKNLQPDYDSGSPAGLYLQSVWLLEGSLVVLPANMDTVRKALSLPKVCGKPLSPYLIKSLTPYAGEKKAQMGYEGKAKLPIPHGDLSKTDVPPPRWKPGVGAIKGLKEIRLKYRSTKGLRRRAKKSAPGTSIIHIDSKDITAVRDMAHKKGLKCALMGTHYTGAEKVKLIGDDGAIDDVAKAYGRRISKKIRTKGLDVKVKNDVPDTPEARPDPNAPPVDTPEEENELVEKWGAQMLRHFHGLHGAMLKDMDEMAAVLEDEDVSNHFRGHGEYLDKFMSDTESLWEKKYGGKTDHNYPPLEGMEAKDENDAKADEVEEDLQEDDEPELDDGDATPSMEDEQGDEDTPEDAAVGGDSSKPEEPTPEEAVEGMHRAEEEDKDKDDGGVKSITKVSTKDIRAKYRRKADEGKTDKEDSKTDKDDKKKGKHPICAHCNKPIMKDAKRVGGKPYHPGCAQFASKAKKSICPECGKEDCTCTKKKDLTEDEAQDLAQDVVTQEADTEARPAIEDTGEGKGVDDRDMPVVAEAHGFLGGISQPNSIFGEEHRMQSYHYHKSLAGIGQVQDMAAQKALPSETADVSPEKARKILKDGTVHGKPLTEKQRGMFGAIAGKDKKSAPGSEEWMQEEMQEPEHKMHPHCKMCKDASDYFLRLSREKAFGDRHRDEARYHHGQLGQIVGGQGKQEENLPEKYQDNEKPTPPDTDDFDETSMKSMLDVQNQQIEELNKALASLAGAI